MRRHTLDLLPAEENFPLPGLQEPEDRPEQRRFPCPVRPDDAGNRPRLDAQPDTVEDIDPLHIPGNYAI
jgi:hypothetical protein